MRRIDSGQIHLRSFTSMTGILIKCVYVMDFLVRMMLHLLFERVERSQLKCQDLFTCEESEVERRAYRVFDWIL